MNTAEYLPRDGEFDPLSATPGVIVPATPKMVQFYTPSELKNYQPPPNQCLVGNYHVQRGAITVLAGPPGCGKSRAALALGILGARGTGNWCGLDVHSQFRTMILQNENGLTRLHRDMEMVRNFDGFDDWLRISAPPVLGMSLQNNAFREELKAMVRDFQPHLVIIDPWNACVRDSMEKDFLEGFMSLREVLAESKNEPAALIVHHLRKPKSDDRFRGRNLAHLLSGSYVMHSMARSLFVMQPASDDPEDARVVVTCAKNNDSDHKPRVALELQDGGFHPVDNFDWEKFDDGGTTQREPKVQERHIMEVFDGGRIRLTHKSAAEKLQAMAGVKHTAAYDALKVQGGRFSHLLVKDPETRLLGLKPESADWADSEADPTDGLD